MGTYLNPGARSYQIALNPDIFIDKSDMILYLNSVVNTSQRFLSVSRPRRFGKTMAADMIGAYYDREAGSRPLFEKVLDVFRASTKSREWAVTFRSLQNSQRLLEATWA